MKLSAVNTLLRAWSETPPINEIVAAYFGFRPSGKRRLSTKEEIIATAVFAMQG